MKLFNTFFRSFSLKSGHNLSKKNISVYASCHNKKLLNLLVPPVLIRISGSGILLVYSSSSKSFVLILFTFPNTRLTLHDKSKLNSVGGLSTTIPLKLFKLSN